MCRYKMPKLVSKQESRLNGAKTNITNLYDISIALRVPEASILKFLSREVGANTEGTTIVKGVHTSADLAALLDKFIARYVLCSKCNYPELVYRAEGKKGLSAACNSCHNVQKMDAEHQAGKTILKELDAMYKDHPDWIIKKGMKPVEGEEELAAMTKKGKKGKKSGAAAEEEEKQRIEDMIANNKEIDALDANDVDICSEEVENAVDELATVLLDEACTVDRVMQNLRTATLVLNVLPEVRFYILLAALVHPKVNSGGVDATFEKHANVLSTLLASDPKGDQHLLQAMIKYYVVKAPEKQKQAPALALYLYNSSVLADSLFIEWHSKKTKLDRGCVLSDVKAEKTMRGLLEEFVTYLSSAEYDEEGDYGDYGAEETKTEPAATPKESEEERNQREMIEAMQKA